VTNELRRAHRSATSNMSSARGRRLPGEQSLERPLVGRATKKDDLKKLEPNSRNSSARVGSEPIAIGGMGLRLAVGANRFRPAYWHMLAPPLGLDNRSNCDNGSGPQGGPSSGALLHLLPPLNRFQCPPPSRNRRLHKSGTHSYTHPSSQLGTSRRVGISFSQATTVDTRFVAVPVRSGR